MESISNQIKTHLLFKVYDFNIHLGDFFFSISDVSEFPCVFFNVKKYLFFQIKTQTNLNSLLRLK